MSAPSIQSPAHSSFDDGTNPSPAIAARAALQSLRLRSGGDLAIVKLTPVAGQGDGTSHFIALLERRSAGFELRRVMVDEGSGQVTIAPALLASRGTPAAEVV